ncbi:STAS domain-containing protein [Alkalihalobacillus sp. BA299]|uniref:STAS domain-containing protein n=1 Tax=Alkalihalobacillus sp. BA299 TaxID=2815938 RepID=UPI001ADC8E91|nr:STAS domain-containing protein [Alkalihalobacillus sp. BA299]
MISYQLNEINQGLEVKLTGDLDIDSTEVMELELIPKLEQYSIVSLNLSSVPFIDSSGIGLLLNTVKALQEKEIQVTITEVKTEVMDVFDMIQLPEILGESVFR